MSTSVVADSLPGWLVDAAPGTTVAVTHPEGFRGRAVLTDSDGWWVLWLEDSALDGVSRAEVAAWSPQRLEAA